MNTSYENGWLAYELGRPIDDGPAHPGEAIAWRAGWRDHRDTLAAIERDLKPTENHNVDHPTD